MTAPGQKSRSLWKVPSWLKPPHEDCLLTYHSDPQRWTKDEEGNHLLQSVAKGQEFVTEVKNITEFSQWFNQLHLKNKKTIKP